MGGTGVCFVFGSYCSFVNVVCEGVNRYDVFREMEIDEKKLVDNFCCGLSFEIVESVSCFIV